MATTTAPNQLDLAAWLAGVPRVAAQIRQPTTRYYGCCVVQCPGAWTRCGPAWRLASGEWVVIGPGVERWGTSAGLAELASSTAPTPRWHAPGVACVPDPNLVFAVLPHVLAQLPDEIRDATAAADALETERE